MHEEMSREGDPHGGAGYGSSAAQNAGQNGTPDLSTVWATLIEDLPPNQPAHPRQLLLGIFHGTPTTKKSFFDIPAGPDHIVLYQKNIEAVCSTEDEVRHQIRQTLIHELGHYFGMTEEQLRDV